MAGENSVICSQEQKFGCFLRWFLILESVFVILVIAGLQFFLWHMGKKPMPVAVAIPILLIITSVSILFWMVKLRTEVRSDGLYVRFFPFHRNFKRFAFEDFGEYYAREYRPLLEYGGWGIRCGKNGKAYNVSGKKGLQIIFKNGKKLLIGSQNPEELVAAIDSVVRK